MKQYLEAFKAKFLSKYMHEKEYVQAVLNFLEQTESYILTEPNIKKYAILERIVAPDRVIHFRVDWYKDDGTLSTNTGYRVQHSQVIGPYKGGLRFHPSVNLSILKFLAFEQTFKNALTGLRMGGAKGGSDFDPKDKSDAEIFRFCQAFMNELHQYIGPHKDIPAGDIGVSAKEIGYLYNTYKKIKGEHTGVLTGKPLSLGGSLLRPEATGYGLVYMAMSALDHFYHEKISNQKIIVSGSGNVSLYAALKVIEYGGIVVAMSDSDGYIYDEKGLDVQHVFDLKTHKKRIKVYLDKYPEVLYNEKSQDIWQESCDLALPCATQNELDLEAAKYLVKHGVKAVLEGANMPTTADAEKFFIANNIVYIPGKAANAGGVSVSYFEMQQNASFKQFDRDTVDVKLKSVMQHIFESIKDEAILQGSPLKLAQASDILAFKIVLEAMIQGGY